MIRLTRVFLAALIAVALGGVFFGSAAAAAPKAAATASPSPTPEPSATPEPPDKAIPRLEARIKANPNDRDALGEIAPYYLQVNRPDLANATAKKLIELGVKTGQSYYMSGYSSLLLGDVQKGIVDLEQAANLEPTNITILGTLTSVYLKTNRPADAERVAKRAITFNKDDKRGYLALGAVYEVEKKFDDARAQYELAAKLDAKDLEPIIAEARSYEAQNAIALASSLYDRALAIDPKNVDALIGKARIFATQHNVKEAIPLYETLRSVVPDADAKASVLDEEARLYAIEKMDGDADATFKRAIAEYPTTLATHLAYGDYLGSKNNAAAAIVEWNAALGANRDNRDALGRLGAYYADQKQFGPAIDNLKRLADITPNDPKAFSALGSIYATQRNWQGAHDAFRRVYELTRAPDALAAVGESDLNIRNYKEAQTIFEAIDKSAPGYVKQDPRMLFLLGQAYEKNNQKDRARGTYTRFLAYLKPGTQAYSQVKKLISDIDHSASPKPASTTSPKK